MSTLPHSRLRNILENLACFEVLSSGQHNSYVIALCCRCVSRYGINYRDDTKCRAVWARQFVNEIKVIVLNACTDDIKDRMMIYVISKTGNETIVDLKIVIWNAYLLFLSTYMLTIIKSRWKIRDEISETNMVRLYFFTAEML